MKILPFTLCALTLAALATSGCTKPVQPAPEATIKVTITSDPGKATLFRDGKPFGETPQILTVTRTEDLLPITATHGQELLVEKRIKYLSLDRVEMSFTFGAGRSAMAKVLKLPRILVFDYGAGVTFDVNHADLKPDFLSLLDHQARLLSGPFAALDVHLCGHTDSQGSNDFNLALSLDRARAVASRLESQGVPKGRLKPEGFGSAYPVAGNDTENGRSLNRRTELILPQ
jgi:outer membrane protein OmpA-like peptidoglycan-associated protein